MIKEIFNLFDTDGQQQLDEEELASAIFAMGFSQNDHLQVPSDCPAYYRYRDQLPFVEIIFRMIFADSVNSH